MEFDLAKLQKEMMSGGGKSQNQQKQKTGNSSYNNRRQNGGGNGYQNNSHGNYQESYVGAPYNFVPFSNFVHEYDSDMPVGHQELSEELISGELEYEITAETPIIVSDGKKDANGEEHFHRNIYGQFSIPGSTMRGLIRNNVQILGLCSMYDDIDDYALMYRNVAGGAEKDRYETVLGSDSVPLDGHSVSVLTNVKAGYIENKGGKYVIHQTCKDSIRPEYKEMNYYVLNERTIVANYLSAKKSGGTFSYEFFTANGQNRLQHELTEFRKGKNPKDGYVGVANKQYSPYIAKISYEIAGERMVTAVGNPGKYSQSGYVISTGKMNNKKVLYIIPEIDKTKNCITIPTEDVIAFRIDIKKKENTLKQFGGKDFFDLPKEGMMKPVFYIHLNGRLYFGFTPRLRLFYDHTIKEGLNQNHKEGVLDYAKVMFGYSGKIASYKSRVSFTDAVLTREPEEETERRMILAEPKPSSYNEYVEPDQDGRAVTYNNSTFKLRGVKQYWLREKVVPVEPKYIKAESAFRPLKKGSAFRGKIRFKNLTREELGLLLWSLTLEKNSRMNVGKAKAYGYGNISVRLLSVRKVNAELAYKNGEVLALNPMEEISAEEMIQAYKSAINKTLAGKRIEELPHIKDFFLMKDASVMPNPSKIRYMDLGKREYQNKKRVLPSVKSVVKK